jgi:CheY-like chemotaxis protein
VALHDNSLQHIASSISGDSGRGPSFDTSLEPTRVLIVDNAESSASLEFLLHELGYWTTRTAFSGASALQIVENFSPTVVLLALQLPDMSAYDVAWRLRERIGLRQVRLIALTGDYEYIYRDLARRAGFERFLAKPVSGPVLRTLLRATLS